MDSSSIEIIGSIVTTAVTTAGLSVGAGWKLLDLRLAKFQNELMDRLNGTYIRRAECNLIHNSTTDKIDGIRAELLRLREDM